MQSGEPGSSGDRSAWFMFVAAASERVVFEATSPNPSIRLTVYIDATPQTPPTFADLVPVAGNPREVDVAPSYDKLVFETTAGTAYFVAMEGWSHSGAAYTLRWRRAELARLLWQHDSGAITIWTVDGAGTLVSHHVFGPFSGWQAVKIAVGPDRRTRVLWRHTSGTISLWTLDTDGNLAGSVVTGPFAGWTASDMVIRSDGDIHLAWTHTNGSLALWKLWPNGSFASSVVYGPYPGWQPLGIAVDSDLTRRILWQGNTGAIGLWSEPLPYGSPSNFGLYGPFTGWTPVDLAAGLADRSARVLWRHSSGAVGLWRQLPNGSVNSTAHGPFPGWKAVAIAVSRSRDGFGDVAWLDKASRVLWRHTNGAIALWKTAEMGALLSSFTYGPFPGWTVIDVTAGPE
jgi:hypothetical protein